MLLPLTATLSGVDVLARKLVVRKRGKREDVLLRGPLTVLLKRTHPRVRRLLLQLMEATRLGMVLCIKSGPPQWQAHRELPRCFNR